MLFVEESHYGMHVKQGPIDVILGQSDQVLLVIAADILVSELNGGVTWISYS